MQLTPYKNLNGNSNIIGFYESDLFIIIQFASNPGANSFYKYSTINPGVSHVEALKELAHRGRGLNSYISKRRLSYEKKSSSLEGAI